MQNSFKLNLVFKLLTALIINNLTMTNLAAAAAEQPKAITVEQLAAIVPKGSLTDAEVRTVLRGRLDQVATSAVAGSGASATVASFHKIKQGIEGDLTQAERIKIAKDRLESDIAAAKYKIDQSRRDWESTKKCLRIVATAACATAIVAAGVYYSVPRTVKVEFGEFKVNVGR